LFLLISNFATSYIGLTLNRGEQMRILNQLLVKDLKELYLFASSQSEIYDFNKDLPGALKSMGAKGLSDLRGQKSLALGVKPGGEITFQASKTVTLDRFADEGALARMSAAKDTQNPEGSFTFRADGAAYFGVFRYHPKWDMFLVRAEEMQEFSADSWKNFWNTSLVILVMTVVCVLVGGFLMRRILRFVRSITDEPGAHRPRPRPQRRRHLPRRGLQLPVERDREPHDHLPEVRDPGPREPGVP
jgi:adenylate cyclase